MKRPTHTLKPRSRIVIKIGTNLLTDQRSGIKRERIREIARSVRTMQGSGHQFVVVSSGAIGAGSAALGGVRRLKSIVQKQAAAAVGQPVLMEAYQSAFRERGGSVAQVLLTKDDFNSRTRYLNAKRTFSILLERGVVPVVNENDTVAVDEIKLGDNDNLSALVAGLIEADLLIILSDIDGLYTDDPARNDSATLISVVESVSPQIELLAKRTRNELSTGGMITKIQAAKRCTAMGIAMIIANGENPVVLDQIFSGDFRGTLFLPEESRLSLRKKWIGFVSHTSGTVTIDSGAQLALQRRHTSLLPSGILEVSGEFKAGDTISIKDAAGLEIAKGLSAFSSSDLRKIKGRKTGAIREILGHLSHEEAVHKDNLVLTPVKAI
ncbi:MAG TPA: glutamate 5-kinase [Bacteroidota bacterium]|nr:glutamate 5-kinase [Bacteroidota bacterium]